MTQRMPAVFVGHGSPLNAIEDSVYSDGWKAMAQHMPRPRAILSVSAHWFTHGTKVNDSDKPQQIYDMYGFPQALYEVKFPVSGAPELAHEVQGLIDSEVEVNNTWGIDHGTWSVLHRMYPAADIPVFQLSVNADLAPQEHYEIGRKIASLRDEGVMILGSGNVVHNLGMVDWSMDGGFDWADKFDRLIKDRVMTGDHESVIDYATFGDIARLSIPTPDHFDPLLYVLGATDKGDRLSIYNDSCTLGTMSMTSYLFE